MAHASITGQEKHDNYKQQFDQLKKALRNEFYLEAIFIEYAILEDRTESVLRHAGLWDAYCKTRKGRMPNIDSKIQFIRKHAQNRSSLLHKYFPDALMEQLRAWKNERNPLIHALLDQKLGPDDLKDLALRGEALMKTLRNGATNFRRALERKQAKEQGLK